MRDPKRIEPILERLKQLWLANSDMRLGQLLENVYPNRPGFEAKYSRPMYFTEDDELLTTIEKFYAANSTFGYQGEEILKKVLDDVKKEPKKKK